VVNTAVFSHSYCCKSRTDDCCPNLTTMSLEATQLACKAFQDFDAKVLVFPTAYQDRWIKERDLKLSQAGKFGIDTGQLVFIGAVEQTFDEINGLADAVRDLRIARLIVVAEYWQMPTSLYLLKRKFPGLEVVPVRFTCSKFDEQDEPYAWKRYRSSRKWAWILTNLLRYAASPLLARWL